jgi:ribosome-associated protein
LARERVNAKAELPAQDLARLAAELALQKKGEQIVILDLRKFSIGCEFFVIISGASDPHIRALSEWIEDELRKQCGSRPWHREGLARARWVLLDYVNVVIHVFDREARDYYRLERLWGDAPQQVMAGADRSSRAAAAELDSAGDEE